MRQGFYLGFELGVYIVKDPIEIHLCGFDPVSLV